MGCAACGGSFGKRFRPQGYERHTETAGDVDIQVGRAGLSPCRYTPTHAEGKLRFSGACQSIVWGEPAGQGAAVEENHTLCSRSSPKAPVPPAPLSTVPDVSQSFPSGMSNGAGITFNLSWGLSQLLVLLAGMRME